jgi:hypothetical protein
MLGAMFSREPEFSGNELAEAIRKVRRRIMVSRWLQQWITACNWIFVALIPMAAMLHFLRAPLVAGGIAIALAAVVAGVRARYLGPSAYEAAQRLDNATRQNDRFATAVYFWSAPDPSPMLLRQREDTVGRIAKLDPESFFPLRMPAKMPWTAGLAAAFGVLCAFHASYGPPLPALKAKLAESRAIEAILAPFSQILANVEGEQGKTSPSDGTEASKRESADSRKLPGLQSSLSSMQKGFAGTANIPPQDGAGASQTTLSASSQNRDALQSGPSGSSSAETNAQTEGRSSDNSSQSPANQGGNATSSSDKLSSLTSRALQALQSLMQGALGQPTPSNASHSNASAPAPQTDQAKADTSSPGTPGGPQSSSAASPPTKGAAGKSSDGADISSTSTHSPLSGAGSAAPAWQTQANRDKLALANGTSEHVPLESNGFAGPPGKDQANVGGGAAQVPLEDVAPPAVATVNGAGQDTVPTRYRQYVRDYFKLGKN